MFDKRVDVTGTLLSERAANEYDDSWWYSEETLRKVFGAREEN